MELNKYIEHTLLKQDATADDVMKLLEEAREYNFLGVCVNPCNVKFAKQYLKDTDIKVVTVIGFPLGQATTESKVLETIDAVKNGADEIDMVLNDGKLKDGDFDYIVNEISAIKTATQGHVLKVILETDLLTQTEIKRACELCIQGGADFVKTSTGFSTHGATIKDVALMRKTVGPDMGVKAAGGVRTPEELKAMVDAGANRIGASHGKNLVK